MSTTDFIPEIEYKEILKKTVVSCIDIIINNNGKFLLLKRKNEPAKGRWWLPGGRIHRGETFETACARKVKQETGLDIKSFENLGVVETIFDSGPFGDPVHTINVMASVDSDGDVNMDSQSEEYVWLDRIDEKYSIHEDTIKYLKKLGYKYG